VPKPFLLAFGGFENLPRFPNPPLTGLTGLDQEAVSKSRK
jgi:hypothetical protein